MQNIGEEIAGEYLKIIKSCDFITYNLQTPDVQGEIDVVGINIAKKELYLCEVAIHLTTGLQYVKNATPNRVNRLVKKITKDINYANKYFPNYKKRFMLWSPIVKNTPNAKYNQLDDVNKIKLIINEKFKVDIELIINKKYSRCLKELRDYTKQQTKELKSPVLRLMQIEEKLAKHLGG